MDGEAKVGVLMEDFEEGLIAARVRRLEDLREVSRGLMRVNAEEEGAHLLVIPAPGMTAAGMPASSLHDLTRPPHRAAGLGIAAAVGKRLREVRGRREVDEA